MLDKAKEIIQPHYTNKERTQLDCVIGLAGDKKMRMVINKYGTDGETVNPDWKLLHEKANQDDIDKNTKAFENEMAAEAERKEAERQRIAGEELFNMKLEIFEMDEIRQSKNTKMKSKIRRSKNKTQAMLYASALIKDELDEPEEEKPAVKKKAPAKKRAPRKKKPELSKGREINETTGKVTLVDTINDDKRGK